ncbi:uncharacterized protein N7459_008384, partial [Penicillium hispanicum]|uniref:uncharacterized protein n=1 Tax=Penicillium hispanicum TaxID=1080232 RepID=UPI00254009C3
PARLAPSSWLTNHPLHLVAIPTTRSSGLLHFRWFPRISLPIQNIFLEVSHLQLTQANPWSTIWRVLMRTFGSQLLVANSPQGSSSPPDFPFMGNSFDPSQPQIPPFPPVPMPAFGFPGLMAPSSLPPAPPNPNAAAETNKLSGSQPRGNSHKTDSTREEGEVSEGESAPDSTLKTDARDSKQAGPGRRAARQLELDRGKSVLSPTRSSSRSSGSPYNPPLSISADPDVVDRAIEAQKRDTTVPVSEDSQRPKTAAQLRVQAQGALLSLAPHNIRYNELVAEGINPAILKRLYEDVGIKVTPPEVQAKAVSSESSGVTARRQSIVVPTKPVPVPVSKKAETPALETKKAPTPKSASTAAPGIAHTLSSPAVQSDSGKPMERKEVIARMLAAKAAKSSEPSASNAPSAEIPTATPSSAPTSNVPTPQSKENGAPTREKNKARTELARQRIEALKQQALLKQQQKAELLNKSQENKPPPSPGPSVPVVQHPLPVRPPIPQPPEHAAIPGLSMTGSQHQVSSQALVGGPQGVAVDSTPVSRAAQRKRPRATDFDEPVIGSKKHIHHGNSNPGTSERLVIDISDDESLYGDDEEEDEMDLDSGHELARAPTTTLNVPEPPLQKYPSTTRASTSTPQGSSRPSDNDHIRKRDLEIQAMRRKIAELEQRRKEKLAASRDESPRTSAQSGASSSSAVQASPGEDVAESSSAPASSSKVLPGTSTTVMNLSERPNLIDSFSETSVRVLASMDLEHEDSVMSDVHVSGPEAMANAVEAPASDANICTNVAVESDASTDSEESAMASESESAGSAMDESIASPGIEQDSPREESLLREQQVSGTSVQTIHPQAGEGSAEVPVAIESTVDKFGDDYTAREDFSSQEDSSRPDKQSGMEQESPKSLDHLPQRPPLPVPEKDEVEKELGSQIHEGDSSYSPPSREASAESDAYEPPEPHVDAESVQSAYSPRFSPSPAPIEEIEGRVSPSEKLDGGETLTEVPQAPVVERGPDFHIGILGTQASSASSEPKFSSYVSPLRSFKAYRYHPNYAEDVPSGYRSLTYSHNIDSMKYFCPYESAGGVCNDRSCEFQHFRDMTLSDDKILIQMGAAREGQTEEEQEAYLAGLKEIINEMRRDKVKDFNTVATEIAAYRRRFLQDPSRVLSL